MFALTFTLVTIASAIIYFYVKYLYSYWQRRGMPYLKPSFPFGNFSKTFIKKFSLGEELAELYRSTSEPVLGIFVLFRPMLLIRDPALIRNILITDFQYFTDREFYIIRKDEPLTAQLGGLRGQQWRDMRATLTPAFTSHRMKVIIPVIVDCGHQLQKHLSKVVDPNEAIEMCKIIACYATNITASVGFGIDVDCLADPNHPFRNAGRKITEINMKNILRYIGWFVEPKLLKWSGLRFVDRAVEEYFLELVAQTLEMRDRNNIVRKDFFQLLVDLHCSDSNTPLDHEDWKTVTTNNAKKSLTFEQVAAQAFGFFLGGFEATSVTTSYCLYEIAKNPDIQRKIHAEIDHVMAEHSGQLTYESINDLKYLDCCIDECLRKYPLVHLGRVCVKDYKIPGTNMVIEKGTSIIIPTFALQRDEKFYPAPETFDPSRFYSECKAGKSMIDMPFMPFGDGPRNCIGQRIGILSVKIGVCSILQQYYVDLDDRHIGKEIKFLLTAHPVDGIHLKLRAKKY